jgi:Cytidine and deoxycytidylate deaminase zinc-binding region
MSTIDPTAPLPRLAIPEYAMALAHVASLRSEDPYRKVGAVALDFDNRVIGTAYNGLAPGYNASAEFWADRDARRSFMIHASSPAATSSSLPAPPNPAQAACKCYAPMASAKSTSTRPILALKHAPSARSMAFTFTKSSSPPSSISIPNCESVRISVGLNRMAWV